MNYSFLKNAKQIADEDGFEDDFIQSRINYNGEKIYEEALIFASNYTLNIISRAEAIFRWHFFNFSKELPALDFNDI
jgi:hypothetical protein